MESLLKTPLSIPDPLAQLLTVPNFYLSLFGENDVETYRNLAHIITTAAPSYVLGF